MRAHCRSLCRRLCAWILVALPSLSAAAGPPTETLVPLPADAAPNAGHAVALDGDTLVVGLAGDDGAGQDAGAALV